MNLLIVKSNNKMLDDNMYGIAKAHNACGYPVAVWDQKAKPAHDVFYEFKPNIVISDKNNKDRAYLKCLDIYKPKVIPLDVIPLSADIVTYGKFELKSEELISDYSATISYSEKEYDFLPKIENKTFKIFSNFQRRVPEYCGVLDDNIKPLIINSCDYFIATNELDYLNAVLLNKNILNKSTFSFKRDFLIKHRTTFHALQKISKNIDIGKIKDFT